ncbi:MAG: porin [Lautropia sp.]|nr:porin [Lautropia sp.]
MKKSLVALAVAAALPAFAQAQTSVQLTGSVDVAVESLNKDANGGAKGDLKVSDGIYGGSRFAIVGSEDLGGGLKALFNLEHRLSADTGTLTEAPFFWRGQSWVGLGGGFGTVRFGRQYTPVHVVVEAGDMTGQSWYYSSGDLPYATRVNNAISYVSPSLGGFTLAAAYAAGEAAADAGADFNKLNDVLGVAGIGAFGPVKVAVGYQTIDGAEINNIKNTNQLGASLGAEFGRFGLGVSYVQNSTKPVAGSTLKDKGMTVSTKFQVTDAGTVYLSFLRNDPRGDDNTQDGIGLTYNHGLSKRTYLYGAVGIGKNKVAGGEDVKPRRIALGLRHFF